MFILKLQWDVGICCLYKTFNHFFLRSINYNQENTPHPRRWSRFRVSTKNRNSPSFRKLNLNSWWKMKLTSRWVRSLLDKPVWSWLGGRSWDKSILNIYLWRSAQNETPKDQKMEYKKYRNNTSLILYLT